LDVFVLSHFELLALREVSGIFGCFVDVDWMYWDRFDWIFFVKYWVFNELLLLVEICGIGGWDCWSAVNDVTLKMGHIQEDLD
jgi:hypothetical protein